VLTSFLQFLIYFGDLSEDLFVRGYLSILHFSTEMNCQLHDLATLHCRRASVAIG